MTASAEVSEDPGPAFTPLRRSSGRMDPARATGPSDHACWGYSTDAERAAVAVRWLRDGLRIGQRAVYVAAGPVERLTSELADLPEALTALETGALVVRPTEELYDLSTPINAAAQLTAYDGAVNKAIADGFQGVRMAADITPLILDPGRRDAHLRWEQIADRYMTNHPLASMCIYDTRQVDGLDAIDCAHPLHGPDERPFGLYGGGPSRAVLQGELDACSADALVDVLRALPTTDSVIDLTNLSFVDARSTWILQDELVRRRAAGQQIRLAEPSRLMQQIWRICDFDRSLLTVT